MSLVLAADYRVADFDRWWPTLLQGLARLPSLGAHHLVVYRSIKDRRRVFMTIGVHEREPVDALLRSPSVFGWFDAAGVDEIPPLFVGQVVEKLDLHDDAAATAGRAAPVIVAAIVSVDRLDLLRDSVHAAVERIAASGVRRFWIYRALDDDREVMILQEIATERQARRWIHYPGAAAEFMTHAGVGVYPPLFVGRLVRTFDLPPSTGP